MQAENGKKGRRVQEHFLGHLFPPPFPKSEPGTGTLCRGGAPLPRNNYYTREKWNGRKARTVQAASGWPFVLCPNDNDISRSAAQITSNAFTPSNGTA